MAIQLPPGVTVGIDLPLHSPLPGCKVDQADGLVAALATPHFPVLRNLHLKTINEGMTAWR